MFFSIFQREKLALVWLYVILARRPAQGHIMPDEAAPGSAGTSDGGGHPKSRDRFSSPLQARAEFLKNWDWHSVIGINQGACERARAQHGIDSETGGACSQEWQKLRTKTLTLAQA